MDYTRSTKPKSYSKSPSKANNKNLPSLSNIVKNAKPPNLVQNSRDSPFDFNKASNVLNASLRSNSSDNISSHKIDEIYNKYSNTEEKSKVRSVFSKRVLNSNEKQIKRFTPVPEISSKSYESPKNNIIQLLAPVDNKKKGFLKSEKNDSEFLAQQLKHYEGIIRKQSEEIAYLKSRISKNIESGSKSISPTYANKKKHMKSFAEFWNFKGGNNEPQHLSEIDGFRNLWICNMESKIINPVDSISQGKKIPSSLLYQFKNSRK